MPQIERNLSLVIPVYNRSADVDRLLASFAHHEVLPGEIILVDNNSTDDTPGVLSRHAKILCGFGCRAIVANCERRGASSARNEGLRQVSAPWVMFFDSDDEIGPRHFANISHAIAANVSADIIGWDCPDDNGVRRFHASDCQRRNLYNGSMATQRWCARADLVRRSGAWDEQVGYWDDIELGARMLALTPKVVHVGLADVLLHDNPISITASGRGNPHACHPALERLEQTLAGCWGAKKAKFRVALKKVVEYANLSRLKRAVTDADTMDKMLKNTLEPFSFYPRTLLTLAFQFRKYGGRGAWLASYFYF